MSRDNGCACVTTIILLLSYEVSTQNYYHTFDTEKGGNYEVTQNLPKPEHTFGMYGNPTLSKLTLKGDNGNIKRPIPNVLYNYPITYKPLNQEVPVKIMNIPPAYDSKDIDNNLTPKIDAYLVANEVNNSNNYNHLKLAPKDIEKTVDRNAPDFSKQEVNYKDIQDDKHDDGIKDDTLGKSEGDENLSDIVKLNDKNFEIIKPTDRINILPKDSNAEDVQRIEEPLIKNMYLYNDDNISKPKSNIEYNKSLLKNLNEVKERVKKIEIILPESDTTTVIISSRNEKDLSNDTAEESQKKSKEISHLEQPQVPSANNHRHIDLRPKDKSIEFNKNKPVGLALNRKIWPTPRAYAVNSHKANTLLYPYLYPNNMLHPRL